MSRKGDAKRLNTHFCPIEYKRRADRKRQEGEAKIYKSSSIEKNAL
jgi:hypothetical protein